ncbi:MAG: CHAT domain-containing protein [Proteobacteria bacterium]|nr:CHAT domain-containing protein [Pseudomonadota bacterium]
MNRSSTWRLTTGRSLIRRPMLWHSMACVVGTMLCMGNASAANCDANLANTPPLYQVNVQIRGQNPVRNTFTVSSNASLMIFAQERGADITLEVLDSSGQLLGRGDNPVRRTGIQRVALAAQSGQRFYIAVTGKDHADSRGSVDLRVVDMNGAGATTCIEAQKHLAAADAAYATGQAVTRAVAGNAPATSSEEAYKDAARGYREAATSLAGAGPSPLLAATQLALATLLDVDGDGYAEARTWAAKAAETHAALGDDYGGARARAIEGASEFDVAVSVKKSGSTDAAKQAETLLADARHQLDAVVSFHLARKEFHDAAWAQNLIGLTFYYQSRYDEAIRAYRRAFPLYERSHERMRQAQVLQNLALVEYELGRLSDSLPHFKQALDAVKAEDNPKFVATLLSNYALANWASGADDLALRQLGDSLALTRTIQDTAQQAAGLHNIATVYASLGDDERALDFYGQAQTLLDVTPNVRTRTALLRAKANILRQQGHAEDALKMDRDALALASTYSKPRIMVQIARDLLVLGRSAEADEQLEAVLSTGSGSDEVQRAKALAVRAQMRSAAGNFAAAEADSRTALETFAAYELPVDQFEAWLTLADLLRHRGATDDAFAAVDRALALAEEVRLQSANPELRSTLMQPLRPAFDQKIAMLAERYQAAAGNPGVQAAFALRALETAEQARGRALADYQTLDVTAPGLDPTLLTHRQTLYRELAARRFRLEARLDRTGTADSESQAIRGEIANLRQEIDQIDARIGAASQNARGRRRERPKPASLALSRIPAGLAIIEYWVGNAGSFAWVVSRDGVKMRRLEASAANINSEASSMHAALRSFGSVPKAQRLEAGERLYKLVMEPLEADIKGVHTLIFALDGALHYVPFATLRCADAGKSVFLVQRYDIAVTPSIQMFLQPAPPTTPPAKQMLLVDDPVYGRFDPRVGNMTAAATSEPAPTLVRGATPGVNLPRLPGAAREAAAIAALMNTGTVDRLDGFAANRDRFLASGLDRYRLIHVATHARTDSEIPQASALILSTVDASGKEVDGRVLAADFVGVRLRADTVVLSACDTALGKRVAGEGLIGLQYVVLARGARSVISSLWPAIDRATADVMVKFYSVLLHQHTTVISAWSAASRATLEGPYGDPGIWGAFMLTLSHVDDVSLQ